MAVKQSLDNYIEASRDKTLLWKLLLGKWGESWPNTHVSVMLLVKARLGFALAQNKDLAQLDLI